MMKNSFYGSIVFVGGSRKWRPLSGHRAPDGLIYEVRSIPGNVVACADTLEQAWKKVLAHVHREVELNGNDSLAWYEKAWQRVTEEDRREFFAGMEALSRSQEPQMKDGRDLFLHNITTPC